MPEEIMSQADIDALIAKMAGGGGDQSDDGTAGDPPTAADTAGDPPTADRKH